MRPAVIMPALVVVNDDMAMSHFHQDIVMGVQPNSFTPQAFHDKPAMVEPVTVHQRTMAEEEFPPVMRQEEAMQIAVPEMIITNEHKGIRPQAKIQVQSHPTAKFKPHSRP